MSDEPAEVSPEAFAILQEFHRNRFINAHDHLIRPALYTPQQIAHRANVLLNHNWNQYVRHAGR